MKAINTIFSFIFLFGIVVSAQPTISFSGKQFFEGRAVYGNGIMLPKVFFKLSNTNPDSVLSGNFGEFNFSALKNTTSVIKAKKTTSFTDNQNGVSTTDLLVLQQHILSKSVLSNPYQIIAADVNGDGKISILDLLYLKRFILGLDSLFPNNRLWTFASLAVNSQIDPNNISYPDSILLKMVNKNVSNIQFTGIKLGDINFDWKPDCIPSSKTDTLSVVTYNVLKYGDKCQASTSVLNGYARKIFSNLGGDLICLPKVSAYNPNDTSLQNNFGLNFRDSVLNSLSPGKYEVAPTTNNSLGDDMNCFFYNKQKFRLCSFQTILSKITDFNMYKLYYLDENLPIHKDTTFVYVSVNHTASGNSSTDRDAQESQLMKSLRKQFAYFPNIIHLGDFNTRNTSEIGYQSIAAGVSDSSLLFYDPPFELEKKFSYPADWENNTSQYASYLTTSTRSSPSKPNSCGTGGGAKSWYDHIFLSNWIKNKKNYVGYQQGSYTVLGNDGKRVGIDINDPKIQNTSVDKDLSEALYQFSNKYPVTIKLIFLPNLLGNSLPNP